MDKYIRTWLYDVLQAINEIDTFLMGDEMTYEAYLADVKTKRAVERNHEIIGEAVNRIMKQEPDFPLADARKIISTRNKIIHGYDDISDQMIWSIVINYLPKLKTEIEHCLDE